MKKKSYWSASPIDILHSGPLCGATPLDGWTLMLLKRVHQNNTRADSLKEGVNSHLSLSFVNTLKADPDVTSKKKGLSLHLPFFGDPVFEVNYGGYSIL